MKGLPPASYPSFTAFSSPTNSLTNAHRQRGQRIIFIVHNFISLVNSLKQASGCREGALHSSLFIADPSENPPSVTVRSSTWLCATIVAALHSYNGRIKLYTNERDSSHPLHQNQLPPPQQTLQQALIGSAVILSRSRAVTILMCG